MNIQELHNRLVKKASLAKYTGSGADFLRDSIAKLNRSRSDKNLIRLAEKTHLASHNFDLKRVLLPFHVPNGALEIPRDIQLLKSPYNEFAHRENKLIDRIANFVDSRKKRIKALKGKDAAEAFEQKLINKYVKELPPQSELLPIYEEGYYLKPYSERVII